VKRVNFDIGKSGVRQIWIGAVRGVRDLVEWLPLDKEDPTSKHKQCSKLRQWYEDCVSTLKEIEDLKGARFDSQGLYGFIRVDVDFLEDILTRFGKRNNLAVLSKKLYESGEAILNEDDDEAAGPSSESSDGSASGEDI